MRRYPLLILLVAAVLAWAGALSFDHPTSTPSHLRTPGLDGPATVRWTTTAPAPKPNPSPTPPPARPAPATPPPTGDLLASLQRGIAAREYAATPNAQGLQAPNRAHGFRAYFEPTGVRLVERTVARPREMVALQLARAGRASRLVATGPGRVAANGARVEICRAAGLVEWYENSPRGLEQGFTLAAPPAGAGPVVLDLDVTGARVRAAGDAAVLESATGRNLRYADLAATDARGHALPAHLAVRGGGLLLSFDDAGAMYPVTIDPLLTGTTDGQLGIAQANSGFGVNLASGGDVNGDGFEDLLVGSNSYDAGQTDEGAVFLFLGGANGIPLFATPSATFQSDQFQGFMGFALGSADVNGDGYTDVLCGAYGYSDGQAAEGAVFVFDGGPAGIANGTPANASAKLEVNLAGHSFGQSVAGAGDVNGDGYEDVVVGAPTGSGGPDAYVFMGGATGVATTPATTLTGTLNDIAFGFAVAGAGDINADGYADICVADPQYKNGETNEGGLFTWLGGPSGIASGSASTAQSILETNHANWYLGYGSLAAAGDVNGDGYADVVVGSLNWTNVESSEGAAIVLRGTATGFPTGNVTLATMATLEMNQASAGVQRVAAGDVNGDGYSDVVVGSASYDFGASNTGAVAVYLGGWNGISSGGPANAVVFLHDGQAAEAFGSGLAVGDWNGDGFADVAVGASGYDAGQANDGAVFLYNGGGRGIPTATQAGALGGFQSNQDGAQLGRVAGAGDVNGDGYSDVIVGSPLYDAGETDEGAAFVIPGGPLGFPITVGAATLLQSNQSGSGFGTSVDGAGDVNGDGYADVIVGSPAHDIGETDEGAAFVFFGGASGVANGDPSTAATTLEGNQVGLQFGTTVAGLGDVNGDGHLDVAVGTPLYDSGHGGVFVFHGAAAGIPSGDPSTAARTLESNLVNTGFGSALAGAGDVNGDGYADLIIGEPTATTQPGFTREGAAWIYQGSASGIPGFDQTQLTGNENDCRFGVSVAAAGDVDGDGYDDVIIGAENYFSNDAGAAFVFRGKATGVTSASPGTSAGVVQGAPANGHLGTSVAGIGDIDGDGRADVAAGAWNTGSGSVYVQKGGPLGLAGSVASTLTLNFSGAHLGASVAGAGDVNGDGFADLVAGAPTWTNPQTLEGGALLWDGGGDIITRASLVHQRRGDGSGIAVQPWNGSHSGSAFAAGMTANDPMGRGRIQIEVETCPDGMPFGSGTCTHAVSGTWTDAGFGTGNPGVALDATPTVANAGLYHWRTRTLHAPFSVTQPGISARPHPAAGPWRRNLGRSFDVDLRIGDLLVAVDRPGPSALFAITPMGNPARGSIVLAATLPNAEPAEVALFDVAGRRLVSRSITRSSGRQTVSLANTGDLVAGVYFVRLTQGGRVASTHVVFLR